MRAACAHPDRLIPFGNLDPRWAGNSPDADFRWLLDRFIAMGCRGIGELGGDLWFDDPRVVNVFRESGALGLPVVIESSGQGPGEYGLKDEVGSPHLERLLQRAPETIVIGHGPGFWAEIGEGLTAKEKSGYPSGPVGAGGSLQRLFRTYPNLHADLSAHSGYNALTRDPEHAVRFLTEFSDRLLFGTDTCFDDEQGRMPQLGYLRGLNAAGQLSQEALDAILGGNAARLLAV
jgi:predicted TIM-barrel fold metal-dependent hydrolase